MTGLMLFIISLMHNRLRTATGLLVYFVSFSSLEFPYDQVNEQFNELHDSEYATSKPQTKLSSNITCKEGQIVLNIFKLN